MPKVVFISHDDFRAGAPILLLHFLRWFKGNCAIPFEILIKSVCGDLIREFEALAPVRVWTPNADQNASALAIESIVESLRHANVGLIYSNTITNGKILEALAPLKCPVICHVHELEYWMNHKTEKYNNEQVTKYTQQYIAASYAVKQSLISNLKITEDKIRLVYEFIPTRHEGSARISVQERIRTELKIPNGAPIVGACGTTDWRKGPDLFIQLARTANAHARKPIYFLWVGGENEGANFAALWHDVKRAGLEEYVRFVGARPNPMDYFAMFDVFALVSREDPFPLVVLEAASLAKPTVCFDASGGAKEFVENGCGFVVPYLNLEAMAQKIREILHSSELRQRLGLQALAKVRERHDLAVVAPQILGIIEDCLKSWSVRRE